MRRFRQWLEETHSTGFELRRHFFLRFFDSDLVSTPGQWQVVAGGVLAVLLSLGIIYIQAYYHKYLILNGLSTPEPFRLSMLADILFLVTFAMLLIGLFTTLQWPLLFPGLRDYMALASLPIRMGDLFAAKFAALTGFAGLFILAITILPSAIMPTVTAGPYAVSAVREIPAIFVSMSAAAVFVFCSLIAVQGVLLNVLPVRQFARVSLAMQGVLLTAILCGLPVMMYIPNLAPVMDRRPEWIAWVPAAWFVGVHEVMVGNHEPLAGRLAWMALAGVVGATVAAILGYFWSYRRHKVRLLETPSVAPDRGGRDRLAAVVDRVIPDSRELAIFAFIGKTLTRSRQHRLILTTFAGLAVAVVFESFASLALNRGFHGFSTQTSGLRIAAISIPLAFSIFVLTGYRYLFRLPVELRANWVFRVNEPGNRRSFLAAVERFLVYWAVAAVALITLPVEMGMLGMGLGAAVAILCLLPSLTLMEVLLIRFDKIPFTSGYLPGRRPVIETLVIYGVSVTLYVTALSTLLNYCLRQPSSALILFGIMVAAWWVARFARLDDWKVGLLEFEELPEPAVRTLSIERD